MMNDNLSLGRTPEEGRKRRRCPVSASTSPFLTKGSSSSTLSPIEMAEMVTMNGVMMTLDVLLREMVKSLRLFNVTGAGLDLMRKDRELKSLPDDQVSGRGALEFLGKILFSPRTWKASSSC